jgi:ATP-dependent Lhr-like helicase
MITYQKEPYKDKEIYQILHPLVRRWFQSRFEKFSPPQRYAIPLIFEGKSCLICAPTGSGKTLTAFLAILNKLISLSEKGKLKSQIYCVYISPLRALGNDIERNLNEPLREISALSELDLGIRVSVRTGDTTSHQKQKMLRWPPHILITTPESFAISLTAKGFSKYFRGVEWVIVDEIHALASSKRGAHLSLSLERLQEITNFVRIGLSATISPLEEVAKFLVGRRYGRFLEGVCDEDLYRDCWVVDARFAKRLDLKVLSPVDDFINCSAQKLWENIYKLLDYLIDHHRTTLIFTNTRSGTERIVHYLKERYEKYAKVIGAHHGSLSREVRLEIEERLKKGDLKAIASSTSLELGIDIGYIDLVILLGSPKSVTRALQRIGRSGHRLHDTIKGRIIVIDQDDLVECAVLAKSATEGKLDRIHIPKNCLDVLAQQIFGILMDGPTYIEDLWELVTRSYNFEGLSREDFDKVLEYLAGEYLEDRRVYAKIWYDEKTDRMGKRGRLARVIYMTNVGTIPDESYVCVKEGPKNIGQIEESFLEMLRKDDIFVLGGNTYRFRFSRGMTAQVEKASGKTPTVPSWFSEVLPLSFELALDIQEFRYQLSQLFKEGQSKEEIKKFISNYHLDECGVNSLYRYFKEQNLHFLIPHRHKILIEFCQEDGKTLVVFHALFGRRVNDCLSRALAWLVARREDKDVQISITDHGFYLGYEGKVSVFKAFNLLENRSLREVLEDSLKDTEILRRRFRHCAARSLMILRNYKGRRKSVGSQQMKASLLQSAVFQLDEYFPVLKEAYREVMEDAMDIEGAERILDEIAKGQIKIEGYLRESVSPFAFHIVMSGRSDLIKLEDRQRFLQRMYQKIRS